MEAIATRAFLETPFVSGYEAERPRLARLQEFHQQLATSSAISYKALCAFGGQRTPGRQRPHGQQWPA